MTPDAKKKLIGALIAAGLAIAVYYGVLDQKQADSIRTQVDQTLGTNPTAQQQPQPVPQQSPVTPQQPPQAQAIPQPAPPNPTSSPQR